MDISPRSNKRRRLSSDRYETDATRSSKERHRHSGKSTQDESSESAPELEESITVSQETNGNDGSNASIFLSKDNNTVSGNSHDEDALQLMNGTSEPVERVLEKEATSLANGTGQTQESPTKRKRGRPRKLPQPESLAENGTQGRTPKRRGRPPGSKRSIANGDERLSLEHGTRDIRQSPEPEDENTDIVTPSRRREKRAAAAAATQSFKDTTDDDGKESDQESERTQAYAEGMSKLPTRKLVGILTPSKRRHDTPKKIVTFGNVDGEDVGLNLGFRDIPKKSDTTKRQSSGDSTSHSRATSSPRDDDSAAAAETPKRKRGRPPKRAVEPLLTESLVDHGTEGSHEALDLDIDEERSALETTRSHFAGIGDLSEKLDILQKVLMNRLTGKRGVSLVGNETEYSKVHQLVKHTVVAGEGNSMLVIGARGTGKTVLVETVISSLKREYPEDFHVVRLDGFFQTDDRQALKEIWRQLGREMDEEETMNKTSNYADTLSSFLALLSHPSELSETEELGKTSKSVVFVINEFDLFAAHPRQTLLYNLFDIAQSRKAPIAVIGATTRVDIMESLEKRVKSRFSHRYVHLPLPPSIPAFWHICEYFLSIEQNQLSELDEHDRAILETPNGLKFLETWKAMITDLYEHDVHFRAHLYRIFYQSKSVRAFLNSALVPIASITPASLPLRGTTFVENDLLPPDSKLHLLPGLSDLALSMLIAAARLDVVLDTDVCNFNMAYDEYCSLAAKAKVQAFTTSSSSYSSLAMSPGGGLRSGAGAGAGTGATPGGPGSASGSAPTTPSKSIPTTTFTTAASSAVKLWPRHLALAAWETLLDVELLIPASTSVGALAAVVAGRAGRMVRVDVALEEIAPSVPGLTGLLAKWCREI